MRTPQEAVQSKRSIKTCTFLTARWSAHKSYSGGRFMSAFGSARRLIAALAAVTFIAGCGSPGTPVGAPAPNGQVPSFTAPAKGAAPFNGKVFVSDLVNDTVWICPANFYDIRNGFTFPMGQLTGVSKPVQIAV